MTQLTSIENLRNSTAMKSRVENVMSFLKRLNPKWEPAWFFPIAIIRVSNDSADCSWVRDHTSTHHKGEGNLTLGGLTAPASAVIAALKGLQLNSQEDLAKIDAALPPVFGQAVSWSAGFVSSEVAAEQAPFAQTGGSAPTNLQPSAAAAKAPAARKSAAPKPITTKPAKPTKLDEAKRLFNELTPKQKVEMAAYCEEKVLASRPCLAEREKLNTAAA
jgi:hypothetical protein